VVSSSEFLAQLRKLYAQEEDGVQERQPLFPTLSPTERLALLEADKTKRYIKRRQNGFRDLPDTPEE
jgi:hypothetical protein